MTDESDHELQIGYAVNLENLSAAEKKKWRKHYSEDISLLLLNKLTW